MRFAVLVFAILGLIACDNTKKSREREGTPITAEFLKSYSGKFSDKQQGEEIEFFGDGTVRLKQIRQIGSSRGPVPENTVCTFFEEGRVTGVFKRSEARKAAYMNYADTLVNITISKITLDRSPGARQTPAENCEKFEKLQTRIGNYSLYAEQLDANRLRFHTAGGGDYDGKGARTESTLDEVFERVP